MYLFETIKCLDGVLYNLPFHNFRLNKGRAEQFSQTKEIELENFIKVPENYQKGLFRCRVFYAAEIKNPEFITHQCREIKSLKLVEDNKIDYRFKYADREKLQNLFDKRENCDDILIVKNGFITDSLTANPVFFDGAKWWTPSSPLLPGTQRARLLHEKKISECRITPADLHKYQMVGLINAMQNLEEMPMIMSENIRF